MDDPLLGQLTGGALSLVKDANRALFQKLFAHRDQRLQRRQRPRTERVDGAGEVWQQRFDPGLMNLDRGPCFT